MVEDVVVPALYLAVVAGAAVAVGQRVAHWSGVEGALDRALVWALAGVVHPVAVGLALGAVGLLQPVPVAGACAITGLLALRGETVPRPRLAPPHAAAALAVAISVAFVALTLLLGFAPGRTEHFESVHYHVAAVAHFRDAGTIWGLPFQNPLVFTAAHPADSAVLGTIVSFSTSDDRLLFGWLMPVSAVLLVLAAAVMAREAKGRPEAGAIAAAALLCSPLAFQSGHSLANDMLPIGGIGAAIALVLLARRDESNRALLLAGAALGLAVGTKYTAFVPAALIGLLCLAIFRPRWRALHLCPGLLVLALPWFVRNAIEYGNPLYPQPVRVAGRELLEGGTGPYDIYSGTVGGILARRDWEALRLWWDLVDRFMAPLLIAAVGGVVLTVLRRPSRPNLATVAVAAMTVGAAIAYAATPYTAGGDPPSPSVMGSNLRYLLPAVYLGLVLLAARLPRPADVVVPLALVAWGAREIWLRPLRDDIELTPRHVAVAALAAVTVMVWLVGRDHLPAWRWSAAPTRGWFTVAGPMLRAACVALVGGAVLLGASRSEPPPTALETAITRAEEQAARAAAAPGTAAGDRAVAVLGVTDVLSVVGDDFERTPEQVADLTPPIQRSAVSVDDALDDVDAPVLVIGDVAGVPEGYVPPPDWCQVDETTNVSVYVRTPAGDCEQEPAVP